MDDVGVVSCTTANGHTTYQTRIGLNEWVTTHSRPPYFAGAEGWARYVAWQIRGQEIRRQVRAQHAAHGVS